MDFSSNRASGSVAILGYRKNLWAVLAELPRWPFGPKAPVFGLLSLAHYRPATMRKMRTRITHAARAPTKTIRCQRARRIISPCLAVSAGYARCCGLLVCSFATNPAARFLLRGPKGDTADLLLLQRQSNPFFFRRHMKSRGIERSQLRQHTSFVPSQACRLPCTTNAFLVHSSRICVSTRICHASRDSVCVRRSSATALSGSFSST